jgi:hypothetical protein
VKEMETDSKTKKTIVEAIDFLNSFGFKVGYATFCKHIKRGWVKRIEGQKGFTNETLLAYGKARLIRTNQEVINATVDFAALRIKADAENKRIAAERGQLRLDVERGKLIERAVMEENISLRAAFFRREGEMLGLTCGPKFMGLFDRTRDLSAKERLDEFNQAWLEVITDWFDAWDSDREYSVSLDTEAAPEEAKPLGRAGGRQRRLSGPQAPGVGKPKAPKVQRVGAET